MRVEVRHQPSFSIARLHLEPGEEAKAESGAMAMHSLGVEVEAKMHGGVMKSLKRSMLGGESLFVTTYRAHPQAAGWVDVAARLPGDIHVADVAPGRDLLVTRGSWLANTAGVELDTKWGGLKMLTGGEGGFILHAAGQGQIVLGCYGAIDVHDLQEGQGFTCDSGHLVAYEPTVHVQTRKATSGVVQMFKSGEGLVMDFTGPGRVVTQSRNPDEFVGWLISLMPTQRA